jgi:hypothetical protein
MLNAPLADDRRHVFSFVGTLGGGVYVNKATKLNPMWRRANGTYSSLSRMNRLKNFTTWWLRNSPKDRLAEKVDDPAELLLRWAGSELTGRN